MMTARRAILLAVASWACCLISPHRARADWLQTGAGPFEYNDTANWNGGIIDDVFPASLNIAGNQAITFNADRVLPGAWQFLYDGAGNLTLRGDGTDRTATLGGNLTVDSVTNTRTVTFGSATAGQNLNVALGAVQRTFTVSTGDSAAFPNIMSGGTAAGSVGIIKQGTGTVSLGQTALATGINTFTGNIQINAGVFEVLQNEGSGTANAVLGNSANDITLNGGTFRPNLSHAAAGRFASGRTITVNAVAGNTLDTPTRFNIGGTGGANNQLLGSGTLTKIGAGDFHLFGTNTYSGTINVQQGTLAFRVANALPSTASVNLTGGNISFIVASATVNVPVAITANTTLSSGAGSANSAGVTHTMGNLAAGTHAIGVVNNGNSTSGTQTLQFTGTHTLTGSPTFTVTNSAGATQVLALNGALGDGGNGFGFTKAGSGQISLIGAAANTFTGTVAVNAGTLVLGKATAIPAGATLVMGGGNIAFTGSPTNPIANTGATINVASGFFGATGFGVGSGTVAQTLAALNMSGSGNFTNGSNSAWTIGTGTFTAGSSYVGNSAGATTFNTLSLTGLSATSAGANGGQANAFVLFGNDATTKGTVTVGAGGLTLSGSNVILRRSTSTEVTGDGGSKLVLGGDVTTTGGSPSAVLEETAYTSVTATSRGTIGIDLNGSVPAGATRMFTVGASAPLTISVPVNNGVGPASLVKAGAGSMTLGAVNAYTGTTTITAGSLTVASGATLGGGDVSVLGTAQSLALLTGVTDAIPDGSILSLAGGGTAGTADAGFADLSLGVSESVGGLVLGGVTQTQPGTYGSAASGADFQSNEYFAGQGVIVLVPEPASAGLAAIAAAGLLARRRRRR